MTTTIARLLTVVCLVASAPTDAGRVFRPGFTIGAAAGGDQENQKKSLLFAVRFQPGPGWDKTKSPADQIGFASHSTNLQRLRREGTVVLGGRFADLGLVVVTATDLDAARALFAGDETIAAKVFSIQVDPWATIFEGCTSAIKSQSS